MVQSPQDPSGGSEQPLSQEDIDAALNEVGLNSAPKSPAAPQAAGPAVAAPPADSSRQSLQNAARAAAQAVASGQVDQAGRPFDQFAAAMAGAIASEVGAPDDGTTPVNMPDFANAKDKDKDLELDKLQMLEDVQLQVRIELGRTRMLVQDVLRLDQGSVVELDKLAGDPVDVYVNGRLVAHGEVLVLNDNFCVRINEIVSSPQETNA